MKNFDALKWIRQVRDANYRKQRHLTLEQQVAQTRQEAAKFRAFRAAKKASKQESQNLATES